jgi:imidazole glycerol phosphate synthase glutamine amidotransferase subunit
MVVVPTGTANLASVLAAFRRLGARPELAREPGDVADASRLVLPGVGSFGAAMGALDGTGMREAIVERVATGRPTLAICVGMQLLAESSEESPDVVGLGVVQAGIARFGPGLRVPQLGWNRVVAGDGCRFLEDGWAYFANSYRLADLPDGWNGATSDYGGGFVSGLESGDILACQFHPELSGAWGSAVLARWLRGAS